MPLLNQVDTRFFTVEVDGLLVCCRAEKNWKVTVHIDRPRVKQYKVAIRTNETREEAVERAVSRASSALPDDKPHEPLSTECHVHNVNTTMFGEEVEQTLNSAGAATSEDSIARPARKRLRPTRFDPSVELSQAERVRIAGRGDGNRWQCAISESSVAACDHPGCSHMRSQLDRLTRKSDKQASAIRELCAELDVACDGLDNCERIAVQHIQHALMELLDEDPADTSEWEQQSDEEVTERAHCYDEGGSSAASGDAPEQQQHAVDSKIGAAHKGVVGIIAMNGEALLWTELNAAAPSVRILFADVRDVSIEQVPRASPFSPPLVNLLVTRGAGETVLFDLRCYSGSARVEADAFMILLQQKLTIPRLHGCDGSDARDDAPSPSVDTAHQASPSISAQSSVRQPTARVRAGRQLREELLRVARLRHDHKSKDADALFSSLDNTLSASVEAARREDALSKQRVRELRDCCFSMGGLSLTKRVIERFLAMPEVRLLLPEAVRQQRQDAVDADTSKLLLDTAKVFLTKIFKARSAGDKRPGEKGGGRRSDEERNAFTAALAALLPASLFENRRGRAAMRILGISYRQAKLGSRVRGELEDWGRGWKRIKTAQHSDKVDYAIVDEFWHSDLASDPDNQNKRKVRVEMGFDEKTGTRLYDLHEQRAQCGTARMLFAVFRNSTFAARLRDVTRTRTRPNGVKLGWRQFLDAKCECVKERKPSECDCQDCTFVTENLRIWHRARRGWFQGGRESCCCRYHRGGRLELKLEIALDAEAVAWAAAAAAAAEDSTTEAAAVWAAAAHVCEARAAIVQRDTYEGMSHDVNTLHSVLLPCGKVKLPEYTTTGAAVFETYQRDCVYGSCKQRIFRSAEACGWDRQYPVVCPLETSDVRFTWRVWEQRVSGKNDEGQPTYTPEFSWSHGTRGEFIGKFQAAVRDWMPHVWRDAMQKQGLRVFEDRKSGRHLAAAHNMLMSAKLRNSALQLVAVTMRERLLLRARALAVVARQDPCVHMLLDVMHDATAVEGAPEEVGIWEVRSIAGTLAALARAAEADARPSVLDALARISSVSVMASTAAADSAGAVYAAAARSATVQSDYAAQILTKRSHTATCARAERHNCLVVVVGYKPYLAQMVRGARKRKARGAQQSGLVDEYRQHVDVFYAFHDASYKPNARSFNVAREDIDHFLKHGTFLYGEWFTGGQRCPGGDRSEPLPEGLSERPLMAPDFPEYNLALECTDGAPTQFANATNHHQTAVWRTKTGIIRRHAKHVEHHGKSSCDGYANVPTHAIHDAVRTNAVLDPTTHMCVRYLARAKQHPSIAKHDKLGWEAADRYFWGYMPPAKFTKHTVPEAEPGRNWKSKSDQEFIGVCEDLALAQKEGPLRAGRLFCGCGPCTMLKFDECTMVAFVGKKLRQITPLAKGVSTEVPQLVALQDWADKLEVGMLVAVCASRDEHVLEGVYWLAKLLSFAYALPHDMVHSGQEFKKGWLVAEAQWYQLQMPDQRGYVLLPEKHLILVNAMVRLAHLKFSGSRSGPQQRILRSGGMSFLGDDEHHTILSNLTQQCD